MINLLFEVFKDMLPFLILLGYTIIAFTLIYVSIDQSVDKNDFKEGLKVSFLIILNSYDAVDFSSLEWGIFVLASLIQPIIMLNVLISIMGDTFDRVQEGFEVADNLELTEMILEVETLMF